jgi:hypothetical protein
MKTLLCVISLVLTLVACSLNTTQAAPVVLGTFDKVLYAYDTSSVFSQGDIRFVWIMSTEETFNYKKDKDYIGAMGRYAIDCKRHTSAFIEGKIIGKDYVILHEMIVPIGKWKLVEVQEHTAQYALHIALCGDDDMKI